MADWSHQSLTLQKIDAAIAARFQSLCVVIPTGGGKTHIGGCFAARHIQQGGRVLWLAHRSELIEQAADRLLGFGLPVSCIKSGSKRPYNPSWPVQVASIETLLARNMIPDADLVIPDECVIGTTIVGTKRADQIRIGDLVESWTGSEIVRRRVLHVFRNPVRTLRTIYIGSHSVTVTDTHPVWIEGKGYVEASKVVPGDMCRMRRSDGIGQHSKNHLFEKMPKHHGKQTHEEAQSHAFERCSPEDERTSAKNRPQTKDTRWQRQGSNGASKKPLEGTPNYLQPLEAGVHLSNWDEDRIRISRPLQDRFSPTKSQTGYRDRRRLSLYDRKAVPRSEERTITDLVRVDSIEVHEPGSDGTFGGRCPEGIVYNFTIEGEHNFFANGILTHNCHHFPQGSRWFRLLEAYAFATKIGLTATPERPDGRALDGFDNLIVGATVAELTAAGVLVPCEIVSPDHALKPDEISEKPIDAYLRYAQGRKTVVFAPHLKAAREFADGFKAAGINAPVVFGDMEPGERARVLGEYKQGRITVLVNVGVLTEGWDDPATSCAILARTCGSQLLWLQIGGRILRSHPGKTDALFIDLAGQLHVHGPFDEEREYSLEGAGIRRKQDAVSGPRFCVVCGVAVEGDATVCADCGIRRPELLVPRALGIPMFRYAKMRKQDEDKRAHNLVKWIREARAKKHKTGAAFAKYAALYGSQPTIEVKLKATLLLRGESIKGATA